MDGFSPIDSKPKEHMESAEDESSRTQLIHRVREPKQKGKGVSVGGRVLVDTMCNSYVHSCRSNDESRKKGQCVSVNTTTIP